MRHWRGGPTSATTSMPGRSCGVRRIRPWACAWTVSTSWPEAPAWTRSLRFRQTSYSSCSSRMPRACGWMSCSGAGTSAASLDRVHSTWSPSSDACSRQATPGRCPWRSSTTSSGRRTRSARPSTAAGHCSGWKSASVPRPGEPAGRGRARLPVGDGDLSGFAFIELNAPPETIQGLERLLAGLGLRRTGQHRTQAGRTVGGRQRADPPEQRASLPGRRRAAGRGRRRPGCHRRGVDRAPSQGTARADRAPAQELGRGGPDRDRIPGWRGDLPLRGGQRLARRFRPVHRRPPAARQGAADRHRSCRARAAADAFP